MHGRHILRWPQSDNELPNSPTPRIWISNKPCSRSAPGNFAYHFVVRKSVVIYHVCYEWLICHSVLIYEFFFPTLSLSSLNSIRSPGPVAPQDVQCEIFQTTYTRIATDNPIPPVPSSTRNNFFHYNEHSKQNQSQHSYHQVKSDLDRRVDDSIETFIRTLSPIGPELMSGCLTVSFFERRGKQKLFGLVHQEEKIVWEQWMLRVVVNNTPRPMGEDEASVIERQRIQVSRLGIFPRM